MMKHFSFLVGVGLVAVYFAYTQFNFGSDCNIKGNVSRSGERIYHVRGGEYYWQTVIDPFNGEKWFCSEEEARVAGWRRSRR
jgi:hypothetical protein